MGELLPAVPTTPNNVTDSWQPLVDSNVMSSYGMNVVTLTEWSTSTVIPAIAQGSAIDIDGSTARFVTTEAIGGAPANGTVYVMFIVSGSTVTAELTATAPIWDNSKGGWYGATGNRYSGHLMTKNGAAYTDKRRYRDENAGDEISILASRGASIPNGVNTVNKSIKTKIFTGATAGDGNALAVPLDIGATTAGRLIGITAVVVNNGIYYSYGTTSNYVTCFMRDNTAASDQNTFSIISEWANAEYIAVITYTEDGV